MEERLYIPRIHKHCITYLEVRSASIHDRLILDEISAPGTHSIGCWGGGAHTLSMNKIVTKISGDREVKWMHFKTLLKHTVA
jgi:hypothetical protein